MAHGINANLVVKWRRQHRDAEVAGAGPEQALAPLLLPITLASPTPTPNDAAAAAPHVPTSASRTSASAGSIELDFAGARLRLRGAVDQDSLVALLTALRGLA